MSSTTEPVATAVVAPSQRRFHITTFSSLKHRDFRFMWGTTFFTAAGNWIQQVTLGWLVYHMTGNAFLTGAVSGVRALPFLFIGPLAGVVADRVDRKMLLIFNHVFLAALGLIFAIMIAANVLQIWEVFVFTFLSGVGWSFNNPVRQTLVPVLVPRDALMNAIALNSAAFNVTGVVGPALGGVLIALFGPATNFFIQAAMYITVTVFVFPIHVPNRSYDAQPRKSVTKDFKEGVKYAFREPTTRAVIIVSMIPAMFMMATTNSLMPVFAKDVLNVGSTGLGILLAAGGLGALVGTLVLASLAGVSRKGLLQLAMAFLAAISLIVFALMHNLLLASVFICLQGGFQMIYFSANNTIIQIITPDQYRGRVMSIYMLNQGAVPLGAFLAGAVAEFFGAPVAIMSAGIITAVLILYMSYQFRELRDFRQ